MMNTDAIEKIEELALGNNRQLLGRAEGLATVLLATSAAAKLVNLEPYMDQRARFRARFSTDSIRDFCKYVVERAGKDGASGMRGFVQAGKRLAADVIFNFGTQEAPGHGDDTAVLALNELPAYVAMQALCGEARGQKHLSEWLEDWSANVELVDSDGNPVGLQVGITAIRNVKIEAKRSSEHNVGDFAVQRSAMEAIEADTSKGMPAKILFTCTPFEHLSSRTFALRISLLTGGDQPKFAVRWIGEATDREDISNEFKDRLTAEIGGLVPLLIGSVNLNPNN